VIAISLWQPWASLFLSPDKIHETRPWEMKHRGWLAIQAARNTGPYADGALSSELASIVRARFGDHWRGVLPRGSVIGAVYIENCYPTEEVSPDEKDFYCGNWEPGRFAIRRDVYFTLNKPIPTIGRQKYFKLLPETNRVLENIVISRQLRGWQSVSL
jgi:hypothetical protein